MLLGVFISVKECELEYKIHIKNNIFYTAYLQWITHVLNQLQFHLHLIVFNIDFIF